MSVNPPVWTPERLEHDRQLAIAEFREMRVTEPLEDYLDFYQTSREAMENALELTNDLHDVQRYAPELMSDAEMAEAARYLASPSISKDDLETIAEVTMARSLIKRDPERGRKLLETILVGLDRERFPWLTEGRSPTEAERETAIVASAALRASRLSETKRRSEGKKQQEGALKEFLINDCGFTQEPQQPGYAIPHLGAAPSPGAFCNEVLVGSRRSDVPIRLRDGRLMPTECKVSNSATNSYKRINNDAAVKAVVWRKEFGEANCVPAAILSGVFGHAHLQYAQDHGLALFWSHDLAPLKEFLASASPA